MARTAVFKTVDTCSIHVYFVIILILVEEVFKHFLKNHIHIYFLIAFFFVTTLAYFILFLTIFWSTNFIFFTITFYF